MKKSLLVLAVAMLSVPAFAQTSVDIGFVGSTKQTTCAIDEVATKKTVRLKTVSINELQQAGAVAENSATDFSIHLTNCPPVHTDPSTSSVFFDNVSVKFDGASPNVTAEGTLKAADGKGWGVRNVEVQISESTGVVNLKNGEVKQVLSLADAVDGKHKFDFTAKFVSKEGKASAGQFESSVPVAITYK